MEYRVEGTENRSNGNHYYICQMNPSNHRRFGKYVVVEKKHGDRTLRMIAQNYPDSDVPDDVVRIDQSIRCGLGFDRNQDNPTGFREKVKVSKLMIPLHKRLSNHLAFVFSFRYLVMRFNRPRIADAEKRIVRIDEDSLRMIGIECNDNVIVEYPVRCGEAYLLMSTSVESIYFEDDYINDDEQIPAVLNPSMVDLPKIYMDYEIAKRIYMLPEHRIISQPQYNPEAYIDLQPIMVRRDIRHLLQKNATQFSMGFFISILGVSSAFGGHLSPVLLVGASVAISMGVTVVKIRSTI